MRDVHERQRATECSVESRPLPAAVQDAFPRILWAEERRAASLRAAIARRFGEEERGWVAEELRPSGGLLQLKRTLADGEDRPEADFLHAARLNH